MATSPASAIQTISPPCSICALSEPGASGSKAFGPPGSARLGAALHAGWTGGPFQTKQDDSLWLTEATVQSKTYFPLPAGPRRLGRQTLACYSTGYLCHRAQRTRVKVTATAAQIECHCSPLPSPPLSGLPGEHPHPVEHRKSPQGVLCLEN